MKPLTFAIEKLKNFQFQAQLHLMDKVKKLESLQKLEQIKQHLIELEKQVVKITSTARRTNVILFVLIVVRKRQTSCKFSRQHGKIGFTLSITK